MLKPRLTKIVKEVFEISGNHDLDKDLELREKLLEFLREEDILLLPWNDENIILAKDVIHFIDAAKLYGEKTDSKQAYLHVQPFLERLIASDLNSWHYYDLEILISSIHFTENIGQSIALASKAEGKIFEFKRVRNTEALQGYLALNMCARILNAKYFDSDVTIDLSKQFRNWMDKLEDLVNENKDFELLLHVTRIRWDIFNRDDSKIHFLCDSLTTCFDEVIGQVIKNEVNFYIGSSIFESENLRKIHGEGLGGDW